MSVNDWGLSVMVIISAMLASAAATVAAPASAEWVLDVTPEYCGLSLAGPTPERGVRVASYRPALSGPAAYIALTPVPAIPGPRWSASITLRPSGETFVVEGVASGISAAEGAMFGTRDASFAAAFARSQAIEIAWAGAAPIRLAYAGMPAASKALEECRAGQLRDLGVEAGSLVEPTPEQVASVALTSTDYPQAALRAEVQGRAVALLTFGADGQATACRIARSAANADLDAATCRVALRMRLGAVAGSTRQVLFQLLWQTPRE